METQASDGETVPEYNYAKGLPTLIAVRVNTKADMSQVIAGILELTNVENVYKVTGDIDVIAVVRTFTSSALNTVIESIRALPGVMKTNSYLVLQEFNKDL